MYTQSHTWNVNWFRNMKFAIPYVIIRDMKHIELYIHSISCKLAEIFASEHCVTDWGGRGHEFQFRMPLPSSTKALRSLKACFGKLASH